MNPKELNDRLPSIVESLVHSVQQQPSLRHLDQIFLPSRDAIIEALEMLRRIIYPGYFGEQEVTSQNLAFCLGNRVVEVSRVLYEQVRCCLRYREQTQGEEVAEEHCGKCDEEAARIVADFLSRLPELREVLATDVQAAFEGDPAAHSTDETIFCYPTVFAVTVQRIAHEFYRMNVPLLPRMMTEYAHSLTGIDIHPGAELGRSLFIDHGTGVVIGETAVIGHHVKIYQGVGLVAKSLAAGQALRGRKRHPTIQDHVTIYAGATILGGETVIGEGAVIGANVFITTSVPPQNQVTHEVPKLRYRDHRHGNSASGDPILYFDI
jgi:serine O-acetyltransferase